MEKIKTYILILSSTFPVHHISKGESTYFPEKFLKGQGKKLGDISSEFGSHLLPKLHTIRANYNHWKKIIDEVSAGTAVLSVRTWSGKPYQTKQKIIMELTKENGVGIQKIEMDKPFAYMVDGKIISLTEKQLANNDGLSVEDFNSWFAWYDLTKPLAIIHFTNFRY